MAKSFSVELAEFVASVSGPIGPDESTLARVQHAVSELSDVVGRLVDDLDEEERAAELPRLKADAIKAAETALERVGNLRPFVKIALAAAIPSVVPMVVEAAATKSTVAAKARDAYVVPALDVAVLTLLRLRIGLAPDAAPLPLPQEVLDGIESLRPAANPNPKADPQPTAGRTVQRPGNG